MFFFNTLTYCTAVNQLHEGSQTHAAHMPRCYCNSKYNTKPPIIPTFLKKCTNSLSNSVGKIAMERSAKAGNLTFFGTALVQWPTFMTNVQWQVSTVDPKQKQKNVSTRTKPTATRGSQQHKRVATREGIRVCRGFPRQWHGSTPQRVRAKSSSLYRGRDKNVLSLVAVGRCFTTTLHDEVRRGKSTRIGEREIERKGGQHVARWSSTVGSIDWVTRCVFFLQRTLQVLTNFYRSSTSKRANVQRKEPRIPCIDQHVGRMQRAGR